MIVLILLLGGCGPKEVNPLEGKIKVGALLPGDGLGDQSFSDLAFAGFIKARDEDDIIIDLLEVSKSGSHKNGFEELAKGDYDIIFAISQDGQEELEEVAQKYPEQSFVLIDAISDIDNVTSITFKENEGSMLAGVVAATITETDTIGFIGGLDVPVINRFKEGFIQGAKSVNPDINILTEYTNSFDDEKIGSNTASKMIDKDADVLYAAAGYTGVGMLKEAEKRNVSAIGVDSDQYFIAEDAVITSMQKNLDVVLFDLLHTLKETGEVPTGHIELGLKDNALGLAPFRAMDLTDKEITELERTIEKAKSNMNE